MKTEKVVEILTDYVNSFDDKSREFNVAMSREHRTLQQSFTKLCFSWIEHVASPKYETDLRNEASKETAQLLLSLLESYNEKQGFSGEAKKFMSLPSKHLSTI